MSIFPRPSPQTSRLPHSCTQQAKGAEVFFLHQAQAEILSGGCDDDFGGTDMRYTVAEIKEIVSALAAQYGADRIYLFGSYARGDADKDSDIDLRIDKGAIRGLQLGGLAADLEDALGIPVDLIPTGSLDSKFLNSISDDEVLLYEAS